MTLSGERDGLLVDLKRSPMRDNFTKLYLWQAAIKSLTINITQRAVTTSPFFVLQIYSSRCVCHANHTHTNTHTQSTAFMRLAEIASRTRHSASGFYYYYYYYYWLIKTPAICSRFGQTRFLFVYYFGCFRAFVSGQANRNGHSGNRSFLFLL